MASGNIGSGAVAARAKPVFDCPNGACFTFGGIVADRIKANLDNWLLVAPKANPAMLEMFYERDREVGRERLSYEGEFAGKYLISAVQALHLTNDARLRKMLKGFVAELIASQAEDGYLGAFPRAERLTGFNRWKLPCPGEAPRPADRLADLWGIYHVMLGLYLFHHATGDAEALAACRRSADLFCRTFLVGDIRVLSAGKHVFNEACIHIFTLLYQETGAPRYLKMVKAIEKDWETPPSGDYVRLANAGKKMFDLPQPRWEGLHSIQAIPELYFITGNTKYRKAFEQLWWGIVECDRHNTGGFSTNEQACGTPYAAGIIETCCTIAWQAVTVSMLRMTGDSRAADELELSTWNNVLGAQSPSGRWWTYNTPMDGQRLAATHQIVFQARPGSPELSCCAVNAPRGLGVLSEWAVMMAKDGVVLNYYGPAVFTVPLPSGRKVTLAQKTNYPVGGEIHLTVTPDSPQRFALHLRIPSWSRRTHVVLNGKSLKNPAPGRFLVLDRAWKPGDVVSLAFDMSPRLWVGERECQGKVSIYHGPILLAFDPRYNSCDPSAIPVVDVTKPPHPAPTWTRALRPLLLLRFCAKDGREITLCDFAFAGATGNKYVSWLPADGLLPAAFTKENPLRAVFPIKL